MEQHRLRPATALYDDGFGGGGGGLMVSNDFISHAPYQKAVLSMLLPPRGLAQPLYEDMLPKPEHGVNKLLIVAPAKAPGRLTAGTHCIQPPAAAHAAAGGKRMACFFCHKMAADTQKLEHHVCKVQPGVERCSPDGCPAKVAAPLQRADKPQLSLHDLHSSAAASMLPFVLSCTPRDLIKSARLDELHPALASNVAELHPPVLPTWPCPLVKELLEPADDAVWCPSHLTFAAVEELFSRHFPSADDHKALTFILVYLMETSQAMWLKVGHLKPSEIAFCLADHAPDMFQLVLCDDCLSRWRRYAPDVAQYKKGILSERFLHQLLEPIVSVDGKAGSLVDLPAELRPVSIGGGSQKPPVCAIAGELRDQPMPPVGTGSEGLVGVRSKMSFFRSVLPLAFFEISLAVVLQLADLQSVELQASCWLDGVYFCKSGVIVNTRRRARNLGVKHRFKVDVLASSVDGRHGLWHAVQPLLHALAIHGNTSWKGARVKVVFVCPASKQSFCAGTDSSRWRFELDCCSVEVPLRSRRARGCTDRLDFGRSLVKPDARESPYASCGECDPDVPCCSLPVYASITAKSNPVEMKANFAWHEQIVTSVEDLSKFANVTHLSLRNCSMSVLPLDITSHVKLEGLDILWSDGLTIDQIYHLSRLLSSICQLRAVKKFDATVCDLSKLPGTGWERLTSVCSRTMLVLLGWMNLLSMRCALEKLYAWKYDSMELPENIRDLKNRVAGNVTQELPVRACIMCVSRVTYVSRMDNPVNMPPSKACDQALDAGRRRLKDLVPGQDQLCADTLNVLGGDTGAGRTSIAQSLLRGSTSLAEADDGTHPADLPHAKRGDKLMYVNGLSRHEIYPTVLLIFLPSGLSLIAITLENTKVQKEQVDQRRMTAFPESILDVIGSSHNEIDAYYCKDFMNEMDEWIERVCSTAKSAKQNRGNALLCRQEKLSLPIKAKLADLRHLAVVSSASISLVTWSCKDPDCGRTTLLALVEKRPRPSARTPASRCLVMNAIRQHKVTGERDRPHLEWTAFSSSHPAASAEDRGRLPSQAVYSIQKNPVESCLAFEVPAALANSWRHLLLRLLQHNEQTSEGPLKLNNEVHDVYLLVVHLVSSNSLGRSETEYVTAAITPSTLLRLCKSAYLRRAGAPASLATATDLGRRDKRAAHRRQLRSGTAPCSEAAVQPKVAPYTLESITAKSDASRAAEVDLSLVTVPGSSPQHPTSGILPHKKLDSIWRSVHSCTATRADCSTRDLLVYTVSPQTSVGTQWPIGGQHTSLLALTLAEVARNAAAFELMRLASFLSWPHLGKLSALNFSSAGFWCTGRTDEVVCFSCGLAANQWTAAVHPLAVHREKCGGQCLLIGDPSKSGNVPLSKTTQPPLLLHGSAEQASLPAAAATTAAAGRPTSTDPDVQSLGSVAAADSGLGYSLTNSLLSAAGGSSVKDARLYTQGAHSNQAGPQQQLREEELNKSESHRLSTFANLWKYGQIVEPGDLARNGFFYTGSGDRVQCAFCQGVLRNWEPGDRVDEQHALHFTYCRFVQGHEVGNAPIPFSPLMVKQVDGVSADTTDSSWERDDLGITRAVPKNPDFAVEARRLSTFTTWPAMHHMQPDLLAKAGFFFLGNGDAVKCFFCDGVVVDWRSNCDPWVEHAQRYPTCSFLIQVQGQDFVQRHRTDELPSNLRAQKTSFAVDPREIRARMDSPKVRVLLQMDYPLDLLREVVQKRLATVGYDHDTSEELLADVFTTHDEKQRATASQAAASRRTAPSEPIVVSLPRDGQSASRSSLPSMPVARAASAAASLPQTPMLIDRALPEPPAEPTESRAAVPEEENRQLKTQLTCKICMDSVVGIVFLPCGHLVCCPVCAPALTTCPICRVSIRGTVRTAF